MLSYVTRGKCDPSERCGVDLFTVPLECLDKTRIKCGSVTVGIDEGDRNEPSSAKYMALSEPLVTSHEASVQGNL